MKMLSKSLGGLLPFFAITLALILLSGGCARRAASDGAKPVLTVSIEPQRNILENLVGDRFEVVSLMRSGENPETFEPAPSRRIDVENSLLYFATGLLPFEQALHRTMADTSKYVDTSRGIELLYGTHSHSHGTGSHAHTHSTTVADPHVWTSLRGIRRMAENMTEALCRVDPQGAPAYQANLDAYCARLDSADAAIARRLAAGANRSFLVWHPSLSYFARDYGLQQIAVGSETKELSPSSLADAIERARHSRVAVMFYQRQYDNRQASAIAGSLGVRLVDIDPGSYDWQSELNKIVDELER